MNPMSAATLFVRIQEWAHEDPDAPVFVDINGTQFPVTDLIFVEEGEDGDNEAYISIEVED